MPDTSPDRPVPAASATLPLTECPGLPRGDDAEPVFRAPWQAQAFAMTVQLHARGLFSWPQWAQALGARLAQDAGGPAAGDAGEAIDRYYTQWLAALEDLLQQRLGVAEEVERHVRAWDHAAHRTPHGLPIVLRDEDFAAGPGTD